MDNSAVMNKNIDDFPEFDSKTFTLGQTHQSNAYYEENKNHSCTQWDIQVSNSPSEIKEEKQLDNGFSTGKTKGVSNHFPSLSELPIMSSSTRKSTQPVEKKPFLKDQKNRKNSFRKQSDSFGLSSTQSHTPQTVDNETVMKTTSSSSGQTREQPFIKVKHFEIKTLEEKVKNIVTQNELYYNGKTSNLENNKKLYHECICYQMDNRNKLEVDFHTLKAGVLQEILEFCRQSIEGIQRQKNQEYGAEKNQIILTIITGEGKHVLYDKVENILSNNQNLYPLFALPDNIGRIKAEIKIK